MACEMGRGKPTGRKARTVSVAPLATVLSRGLRVRIGTQGQTGVVLDGYGPKVLLELEDGSPRLVPRKEVTVIPSA